MAIQKISIEAYIALQTNHILIDVRSPSEFQHAHILNAKSLPLFNNEERALVGTTYKQKSREDAIKIGLPLFGTKMLGMIEKVESWIEALQQNKPDLVVHCWRGGMRSAAVAWLLDLYGFKVYQLIGGYKAYRNWVLQQFNETYTIKVLGGYTGSGKTEILHELKNRNQPIIDLEGLAHHKGSAFGAIGQIIQPSQEMFENKLAQALHGIPKSTSTIWVEDESQRIGSVIIPIDFFKQMRNSVCHFITIPFQERLKFIVSAYGEFDVQDLIDASLRIQKRLGGLETKNVVQYLNEKNIDAAFSILLAYYDKWYAKHSQQNTQPKLLILPIVSDKVDAIYNADLVETL